jgi:hypothetical protein
MADTKLIPSTAAALEALSALTEWAEQLDLAYAWASSATGSAAHWKALPLKKVRRAVVGTHFAQTEPFVLRQLSGRGTLRVFADADGVFHPKVIFGRTGTTARALIGSSNFTSNGFGGNTELNVLISGATFDHILTEIQNFIDGLWNAPEAFTPNEEWLTRYEGIYAKRPYPPDVPKGPPPVKMIASTRLTVRQTWFTDGGGGHGITIGKETCNRLGLKPGGPNGDARVFVDGKFIARGAVNAGNSGRLTNVDALLRHLGLSQQDVGTTKIDLALEEDAEGFRLAFRRVDPAQ